MQERNISDLTIEQFKCHIFKNCCHGSLQSLLSVEFTDIAYINIHDIYNTYYMLMTCTAFGACNDKFAGAEMRAPSN